MKFKNIDFQIFLLIALAVAPTLGELFAPWGFQPKKIHPPPAQKETTEHTFEQILDHFKPLDTRTWEQVCKIEINFARANFFVMF